MNTLVLESTEHGDVPVDVYQKLADNRILFICNEITDELATDIVATLLLKDAEDSDSKITLFINSEGGDIRNALMIYDMINIINAPVETVCIGSAMDEAALILSAGMSGMRFATKNARISVSQLVHNFTTKANLTDAKKYLDLELSDNKRMINIFSQRTGKTVKQITADFERRMFMTPPQALKYGIIDKIITFGKGV